MKTQLNSLRSGSTNQILNKNINYVNPIIGSYHIEVDELWNKVIAENPNELKATLKGLDLILEAKWSLSKKSVNYMCPISNDVLENIFFLKGTKKEKGYVLIQKNTILIHNGGKSFTYVCPSFLSIN